MNISQKLAVATAGISLSFAAVGAKLAQAEPGAIGNDKTPQYERIATIQVPGKPLASFDISWVDSLTGTYYLADRSNGSIDIFDIRSNTFTDRVEGFVGFNPAKGNDFAGPNGVVVVNHREVWASDGDSTVKVIDLKSRSIVATISTGGEKRADEIAYDPKDGIIMVVNNADDPPFATLISTDPNNRKVIGRVEIPNATGGLEQPVWDSFTKQFYLSVPELDGNSTKGAIATINPKTLAVTQLFQVNDCMPSGLTLGPHQQLLVGCSQTEPPVQSLVISAITGDIIATIPQVGGSDEVWYNRGDKHYYLAARNQPGGPVLGIIDARTNMWLQNVPTANNAHSVAADALTNKIFVPLTPIATDPQCVNGCIGVYADVNHLTSTHSQY